MNNYILPEVWEQHFRGLYSSSELQEHENDELENLPQWFPVNPLEVRDLIQTLKPGKAPGSDLITSELIKKNADWWVPIITSLFTAIDNTGKIPKDWGLAIIVPIYKKGNTNLPSNYRPISLLNILSKLYARHLQWKLRDWIAQENCLAEEQAGFREGHSTLDQCVILDHLISKYSSKNPVSLYAAFIDFRSAFDSISRNILWAKLRDSKIDKRLLFLIRALHKNTTIRVKLNPQGHLTNPIETKKGVRQGCILAPLLFNLYINDLVTHLNKLEHHPPKLASKHISILLYADDAVLLSKTPLGLKRMMQTLTKYSQQNRLEINYDKTKVISFANRPKRHSWYLNQTHIEQVQQYKYLGVIVQANGKKNLHIKYVVSNAQKSANAIQKFF